MYTHTHTHTHTSAMYPVQPRCPLPSACRQQAPSLCTHAVCNASPSQAHGSKHADRDQFWFLALVVLAVSLLKVEKTTTNELLNRDQVLYYKSVTRVRQEFHKSVTRVLQECDKWFGCVLHLTLLALDGGVEGLDAVHLPRVPLL
jgi:hypothetical protein